MASSATASPHPSNHQGASSSSSSSLHQQHLAMDFDLNDFANIPSGNHSNDVDLFHRPGSAMTSQDVEAGPASVGNSSTSSESRYPTLPSRQQHHSRSGSNAAGSTYPSPAESMSRGQTSSSNHQSPSHQQHIPQQQQQQQQQQPTLLRTNSTNHHPLHSVYSAQSDPALSPQQDSVANDTNAQLTQLLSALGNSAASFTRNEVEPAPQGSNAQMSLQDIQRLLAEKEQSDRLQHLQTALLRQQLEALQRAQQTTPAVNQVPLQHQKDAQGAQPSLQQLLTMLGNGSATTDNTHPSQVNQGQQHQQQQQQLEAHHLLANILGGQPPQGGGGSSDYSKALADSASLLAQYGVLTPPASGALNIGAPRQQPFMSPLHIPPGAAGGNGVVNGGGTLVGMDGTQPRPWDNQIRNQYTPLESPAVTPASVFSNMSLGGISSAEQFFSPLTSPALHPTPPQPFFSTNPKKPHGKSTTPSASPLALTGKPGPLPRKNRSTTAEARANRSRPSPMIKPTIGNGHKRKKEATGAEVGLPTDAATAGGSSQRRSLSEHGCGGPAAETSNMVGSHSHQGSFSTFLPVTGDGATISMGASPSEGAASTPSPIDLGNNQTSMGPPGPPSDPSKPLTPGSIMGIANSAKRASSQRKRPLEGKGSHASGTGSATISINGVRATKGKGRAGGQQQVSFAEEEEAEANADEDGEDDDAETTKGGASSGSGGGGGAPDSRRTSHKAAEQKRRDSLKYCFDELRCMLPPITLDEDAPGGSSLGPDGLTEDEEAEGFDRSEVMDAEYSRTANRAISKVALLRHSNEWIVRLRNRLARRDEALARARAEIESLRTLLLAHGGVGGFNPAVAGLLGVGVGVANSGLTPGFNGHAFSAGAGAGGGGGSTGPGSGSAPGTGGAGAGGQAHMQHLLHHNPGMDWV